MNPRPRNIKAPTKTGGKFVGAKCVNFFRAAFHIPFRVLPRFDNPPGECPTSTDNERTF